MKMEFQYETLVKIRILYRLNQWCFIEKHQFKTFINGENVNWFGIWKII